MELRILAHLSGDAALAEAFAAETDIHRWTAARLGGKDAADVSKAERERSKMVNYGVLYGMGARGLAARLRKEPVGKGKIVGVKRVYIVEQDGTVSLTPTFRDIGM